MKRRCLCRVTLNREEGHGARERSVVDSSAFSGIFPVPEMDTRHVWRSLWRKNTGVRAEGWTSSTTLDYKLKSGRCCISASPQHGKLLSQFFSLAEKMNILMFGDSLSEETQYNSVV